MGTTRSLHCVYVKPVFEDEIVLVECEASTVAVLAEPRPQRLNAHQIVHAGKRLCLLKGTMKREKDGAVVATCEHNKYNIDADDARM